ncbi:Capsular polysaccharide biosynthesis/export periplasmic protein WcbA; Capsular polysaccharide export system protein KpsC [hydrothermal vent metagenome]|uniref:Capsular polysaccharide biosynthesis/export periplasmic protein WcbA Capsular polysaccharide export system protein KpsC n=1 Tax=hydrothermal vent metagenome TaxID=652676 RepID=A0A1W1C7Q5_9ZZZZ
MYKIFGIFVVSISILLISGCGIGRSDYELMQNNKCVKSEKKISIGSIEYKIMPHDRLSITIYQYPELTPTDMNKNGILIDSKGYISLPLIHRVKIAGYTQSQAAKLIENRYKKYLTDPSLNIEVMNKRVYVLGEVKSPGVVQLDNEMGTVMQVIAHAGGFTDSARRDNIYIVSSDSDNNLKMRKVDMTSFAALQRSNIVVKPNDVLYIQPSKWKSFKIAADDFTSPFETITKLAAPFVTLKYLSED